MKLRELMEEVDIDKILIAAIDKKNMPTIHLASYYVSQLGYYFDKISSGTRAKIVSELKKIAQILNGEQNPEMAKMVDYINNDKNSSFPKDFHKKMFNMFTTGIGDVKKTTKEIKDKSTKLPKKEFKL